MQHTRRVNRLQGCTAATRETPTPAPVVEPDDPAEERLALRAWQRYVRVARDPRQAELDIVELFIDETRPARPDATCAALLLALDVAHGRDSFLEGSWIPTAVTHVHTWYDGPGFRQLGTIALIERFVDWLHSRGWIDDDEHARLFAQADEARCALGAPRRRPPTFIEPCHRFGLERLIERFVDEGELSPMARELAPGAIRLLRTLLTSDGGPVIFGRLRPDVHIPWLLAQAGAAEDPQADRQLHAIWACFYRWLARTGQIEPERARRIERQLLRFALAALTTRI